MSPNPHGARERERDGGNSAARRQFERLAVEIYGQSDQACVALAAEVRALVESRAAAGEKAVLGLATGSTPVPFYRELVRMHRDEGLSLANVVTFNLDEYYGVPRNHPESYYRFMQEQLFAHVDIAAENVHVPDGTVPMEDVFAACEDYEARIEEEGGIDLQILGIGRTGHIGFNEPGSKRTSRTRLIALDRVTRQDAAADFLGEENVPRFAVTMGVGTILAARKIVLMAWGENKAEIVAHAVEGPVTDAVSASYLQDHPEARFVIDEAAASRLVRVRLPWLVGPVTWGRAETRRAVTWLAAKQDKPVLKLLDEEYNENGMGELLTREGTAYHLNIRIFNELQHTITGWPGGKHGADDTNRPETAAPFPKRVLVLAPEPEDDILSMAGTLDRLVEQGHEVRVVYQTSGSLRVADAAAANFAGILLEQARGEGKAWAAQEAFARQIIAEIEEKGPFGEHPPALRRLKALIRRGEARDACSVLGIRPEQMQFLDLPFYEQGRYRRFVLGDDDVARMRAVLEAFGPHQIFATGAAADPSSVQAIAFRAFSRALDSVAGAEWAMNCSLWLYRGHQGVLEPHEISMAVPMSPDQLVLKVSAIHKFQNHSSPTNVDGHQNQAIARQYDALGLAEYEAIEAFERWRG